MKNIIIYAITVLFLNIFIIVGSADGEDYTIDINGGDCNNVGTWDNNKKICTLNKDLTLTNVKFNIIDSGITLNGNLNTMTANKRSDAAINIEKRGSTINSVTVENFKIIGDYKYDHGIKIYDCDSGNIKIINNDISGTTIAIYVYYCRYTRDDINIIDNNRLFKNGDGIYGISSSLSITNNRISNIGNGIRLKDSFANRIHNNYIIDNTIGINFESTRDSNIYNNYLYNKNRNVDFNGEVKLNNWNYFKNSPEEGENIIGGKYIGGNFWGTPNNDGFSQTCDGSNDFEGICKDAYKVGGHNNNIDKWPLRCSGNTPIGENVKVIPVNNFKLTFNKVTGCGITEVKRINDPQKPFPNNDYKGLRFYDISTTAKYEGNIEIIIYSGEIEQDIKNKNIDFAILKLLHIPGAATEWIVIGNGIVHGGRPWALIGTINSLSPFAIAYEESTAEDTIPEGEQCNSCHAIYDKVKGYNFDPIGFIMLCISLLIIGIYTLRKKR